MELSDATQLATCGQRMVWPNKVSQSIQEPRALRGTSASRMKLELPRPVAAALILRRPLSIAVFARAS
jgi:hypothetical protein